MINKRWTQEEDNIAIEMIKKYYSYNEIANVLNRTSKSIMCRMQKLGYTRDKFSTSTKNCSNCNKLFDFRISTNRKFCSQSCSMIFINKQKQILIFNENKRFCLNCNTSLYDKPLEQKYCNNFCHHNFVQKIKIKENKASATTAKSWLLKQDYSCSVCKNTTWNEQKIPLELDHIDGNSTNNNLENLRLICPNCHALTSTYKAKNIGKGRHMRMKRYHDGKSF